MSKKSIHITLGVLILLYLGTNFLALNETIIYVPDSGRYLIWANSIARGEGYRDATSPEPTRYVVHSPLYALFLAPSQMIFPHSIEAAKATTVLFGALAILGFFLLLKMFIPEEYALWGAILFILHPETINYSTQVLTEIPFVCVTLYAIILIQRYTTNQNNSWMTKAAIAILVSVSVLLREVGVVFAFAVILYLFLMKKRRAAAMLLALVIAVYGAWFVRNEIIVASQENPATRNSKIFSIHMYTSNSDSMLDEYTARIVTNGKVYGNILLRLGFFSGFRFPLIPQLYYEGFPVNTVQKLDWLFIWFGNTFFLVLFLAGLVFAFRRKQSINFLLIAYTVFSLCVLLLYPITDIRFLFPILPVLLFYFLYGLKNCIDVLAQRWKPASVFLFALLFIALIPNCVWSETYELENIQYAYSPTSVFPYAERGHQLFARSLKRGSSWICAHTEPDAIVMGKWNEIAMYLQGRKIVLTNAQAYPPEFQNVIRDYNVQYLLCGLLPPPANEYTQLFAQVERYRFIPVYREGALEIRKIVPRNKFNETAPADSALVIPDYEKDFYIGTTLLETDPQKAVDHFIQMGVKYRTIDCLFNLAIAYEFLDSLDLAEKNFKKFLFLNQAGSYLSVVNGHLDNIAFLRKVKETEPKPLKANLYHIVSMTLWYQGFPLQSQRMLKRAMKEDSTFFPAYITSAIFSFQLGDTSASKQFLFHAKKLAPNNVLTKNFVKVHAYCDSIKRRSTSAEERVRYKLAIASSYRDMGFIDAAIDEALDILDARPNEKKALELLANYWEAKKRYYSAWRVYGKLLTLEPNNEEYQLHYAYLSEKLK